VDQLVSPEHPRLVGQTKAHEHLLRQQIAAATTGSGMRLDQVLA
jgi:hypothetical protein